MSDNSKFKKAVLDPPDVFETPAEVLADIDFTDAQKIEILRRWEYDASEISVAEEEGMPVRNGDILQEIMCALLELTGDLDTGHTPPTKQGGLDRQSVKADPEHE